MIEIFFAQIPVCAVTQSNYGNRHLLGLAISPSEDLDEILGALAEVRLRSRNMRNRAHDGSGVAICRGLQVTLEGWLGIERLN